MSASAPDVKKAAPGKTRLTPSPALTAEVRRLISGAQAASSDFNEKGEMDGRRKRASVKLYQYPITGKKRGLTGAAVGDADGQPKSKARKTNDKPDRNKSVARKTTRGKQPSKKSGGDSRKKSVKSAGVGHVKRNAIKKTDSGKDKGRAPKKMGFVAAKNKTSRKTASGASTRDGRQKLQVNKPKPQPQKKSKDWAPRRSAGKIDVSLP